MGQRGRADQLTESQARRLYKLGSEVITLALPAAVKRVTEQEALIRELREELGIDTEESCLAPLTFASHAYQDFHLLMPLYVCRVWQGRPEAREEQQLAWVKPKGLADYPMPPADRPLVAMLRDLL